jgi:hypothetical protein
MLMLKQALLGSVVPLLFATVTCASPTGFTCISGHSILNCATGAAQLFYNVTDVGGTQTRIDVVNTGPLASTITQIYFDDTNSRLLGNFVSFAPSAGVRFVTGGHPSNLPAGQNAVPVFQADYLASRCTGKGCSVADGIDAGQSLGLLFNDGGSTFADIVTDLADGDLRLGLHVQNFANGGSESFVDMPSSGGTAAPVPEPATLVLFGTGLGIVAFLKKLRRPGTDA